MNTEDRLREALQHEAKTIDPPDAWSDIEARIGRRLHAPRNAFLAAAAALLVVIGAIAVLRDDPHRSLVNAGNEACRELSVPAEGASPEFLCDGTPVWVVRHEDGTVSVLGALSYRPLGIGRLTEWCSDYPHFEDVFASKYDEFGLKIGGPAPGGVDVYEFKQLDRTHVEITRNLGRTSLTQFSQIPITKPNTCAGVHLPEHTIWHDASVLKGRDNGFRFLSGDLVISVGARLCMPSARDCESELPVIGINPDSLRGGPLNVAGPFIGRVGEQGVTDIISVREPPTS